MESIRIVWGTGRGPTELAAYDAALAAANIHQYNLLRLSSVIPPSATVTETGSAPALAPTGGKLYTVEAAATTAAGPVTAALAWTRGDDGAGIFYEAAGAEPSEPVTDRARAGLEAGAKLRSMRADQSQVRATTTEQSPADSESAAAVVAAVYGSPRPLLETR